jgi:hypothetical protein
MTNALSRYLKDFGAEQAAAAVVMPEIIHEDEPDFAEILEPSAPPVDIEAVKREAYAEGHEAATQALNEAHEIELEALRTAHREEIEALQSEFQTSAGERIAEHLQQVSTALGQAVSSSVAAMLAPVMTEALTDIAIAELAELVTAAILEGDVGQISVTGPRALFDTLVSKLGESGELLAHVEADDIDLSVAIGESVLVTRISAWTDGVRKVLE